MCDRHAEQVTGHETSETASGNRDDGRFDTATVECYKRRKQVLSSAQRTEWWMAIAVVLITAGVAFVVL